MLARTRIALAALAALLWLVAAAPGLAAEPAPPEIPARSFILVDADDGEVIAARAADQQSSIASTTKLMTAYVARRSLRLSQEVVAPPYQPLAAESLLGLETGERIEVRDLLYGLLLASGNDAAVALAEASAGSVSRFVERMNAAARRLGLDATSYANPIGLDEIGNHSTARDLAELTVRLRRDRVFRRIFDTAAYDTGSGMRPRHLVNRNMLVLNVPWIDGVKTGYTLEAGFVLVGSGEQRGIELVSVILGAPSEAARDAATLELLEYGFSLYTRHEPLRRGERLDSIAVRHQEITVPAVADRGVEVTVRDDQNVETEVRLPAEVEGPIARGERLGEAIVTVDGRAVDTVALSAARAVPEASLLDRVDSSVPGSRVVVFVVAIGGLAALFVAALAISDRRRRKQPLG